MKKLLIGIMLLAICTAQAGIAPSKMAHEYIEGAVQSILTSEGLSLDKRSINISHSIGDFVMSPMKAIDMDSCDRYDVSFVVHDEQGKRYAGETHFAVCVNCKIYNNTSIEKLEPISGKLVHFQISNGFFNRDQTIDDLNIEELD